MTPASISTLHPQHTPAQVLRGNAESILTIIEVLIHDPLYRWAITGPQMKVRQPSVDVPAEGDADPGITVVNADAERTILRVKQKLTGTDFGRLASKTLTVLYNRMLCDCGIFSLTNIITVPDRSGTLVPPQAPIGR